MDGIFAGIYSILVFICLVGLVIIYQISKMEKKIEYIKNESTKEPKYTIAQIEHKTKDNRSQKASFRMKEKWRKLKELEDIEKKNQAG